MHAFRQLEVTPAGVAVELDVDAQTITLYPYRRSATGCRITLTATDAHRVIETVDRFLRVLESGQPDTVALGTESEFEGEPF